MSSRRAQFLGLLAIVALAFVLRFRGLGHQLPQWTYLDGYVELVQTRYLRDPESVAWPDMNLGYYPYLTSAAAAALPGVPAARGEGGAIEAVLEQSREPWVRVRLAALLLSLGAVVGAWGLARRIVSPSFALLAAAIVATSLVHVTFSAEQRPHGPASGTVALAMWALIALRRDGGTRSQLVAALAVGLAIATLQSSLALLLPWALAWWLRGARGSWKRELGLALVSLAIVAVCVRLAYPFHFDERSGSAGEYETGAETMWMGGHALYTERFHARGFGVMLNTFAGFDPWLLGLVALSTFVWIVQRSRRGASSDRGARADAWICLGYVAPFVVVFGLYDMTYDRFVLPLVPFFAVWVAWACERARAAFPQRVHGAATATLFALVLAFPFALAWRLGSLRQREDTFELAARWIERNVDPQERVLLLQNIDVPVFYERESLQQLNDSTTLWWTAFQRSLPDSAVTGPAFRIARPPRNAEGEEADAEFLTAKKLRAEGFRYLVALPPRRGGVHDAETVDALKSLRKGLERAALFAPAGEDERRTRTADFGFGVTESSTMWNLLSIEAFGPRIEVFRL
jgi:hypothetical protein